MKLTPEEEAVGRENFYAAAGFTRRDFLKGSLAAGVVSGGGLGAFYFGYEKSIAKPLRVGVIGCGDEGNVLIGAITPEFIDVVAIADIRPYNIHRTFHGDHSGAPGPGYEQLLQIRTGLIAKYGYKTEDAARKHVKVYDQDYHDLIKDPNVEAVIIALPLHLHCKVAIEAMEAGKHVLTEKLMGQTVAQCKDMGRVSDKTGKLLSVGHQRHYSILYDNAVQMIRSGLLGDLHYIRGQWHRGNLPGKDSWQMPLPPGVRKPADKAGDLTKMRDRALATLNAIKNAKDPTAKEIVMWEKKLAQFNKQIEDQVVDAAKYGYEDKRIKDAAGNLLYHCPPLEELIRWRLWDRTGAGLMAELGSHQLDAASIFVTAAHAMDKDAGAKVEKVHPLSVCASAARSLFPADRDVEDHVFCIIEFPAPGYDKKDAVASRKKIGYQYASINGNGFGGYGEIIFGTSGTLVLEREKEAFLYKGSDTSSKVEVGKGKDGGPTLNTQASGPAPTAAARLGALALGDISRGYTEELEHFAWCIRNPAKDHIPRCHPRVAMGDAIIALTTNKAAREGLRIDFDEEWFDLNSDKTPDGSKPSVPPA